MTWLKEEDTAMLFGCLVILLGIPLLVIGALSLSTNLEIPRDNLAEYDRNGLIVISLSSILNLLEGRLLKTDELKEILSDLNKLENCNKSPGSTPGPSPQSICGSSANSPSGPSGDISKMCQNVVNNLNCAKKLTPNGLVQTFLLATAVDALKDLSSDEQQRITREFNLNLDNNKIEAQIRSKLLVGSSEQRFNQAVLYCQQIVSVIVGSILIMLGIFFIIYHFKNIRRLHRLRR